MTKSATRSAWGLLVLVLVVSMVVGGCKNKRRRRSKRGRRSAVTAPRQPAAGFDLDAAKQTLLANPWKGVAAGKPALLVFKASDKAKSGIWAIMTLGAEQQACFVNLDTRGYFSVSTKGKPTNRGLTKISLGTKLASPTFTSLAGTVERTHKRGFMEQSSQIGTFQLTKTDAKAIAAFYKAGCDGGDKTACFQVAVGHMRAQEGKEMEAAFKKSCVLGLLRACGTLGLIYRVGRHGIAKDDKKARAYWSKACDDGYAQSCVDLGNLLKKKQLNKALGYFQKACKAKNATGCNNYAWNIATEKKKPGAKLLAKALASARRAVELNPDPNHIDTLAWVYFKQKDYARAEIEIQRALQLKPDNKEMQGHLAAIQKAMKK